MDGMQELIFLKVIIIGAGPAGLLAALRLKASNNIAPTLYEVRDVPTTLGGAIGIPSNGLRLLHRLGAYERLLARGALTPNIVLHSTRGNVVGEMDSVSWSKEQTGFSYLRIQRTDIVDVLMEMVKEANIPIHFGKHLSAISEDETGVTATFADGSSAKADLLLGCDGIHSAVRKLYVDPELVPSYTGIANLYSLVDSSKVHKEFSSLKNLNATLTTDGLFAVTPCKTDSSIMYWFFSRETAIPKGGDTRDGWEAHGQKETDDFKDILKSLLGNSSTQWIQMLQDLVKNTATVKFYPVFKIPTGRPWAKGRCLIIGDAAHAMPPHASQGVSMATEDVFLLSNLLRKSEIMTFDELVRQYEQRRRPRTEEMLKTAERNGTVRTKTHPLRLRLSELAIGGGLKLYHAFGLEKLGIGQKPLAYDIDAEQFGEQKL